MRIWKVKTVHCECGSELEKELNRLEQSKRGIKEIIHKEYNFYEIVYTEEDVFEVND